MGAAGPIFGNFGIRRLVDQNQRFMRGGLPAWLRIKNFQDNAAYADMGFQYVPSATGTQVPTGTTDILISPPPSINAISMHTLLLAQMAGASLRGGARKVLISHTWVFAQMSAAWFLAMCAANNLNNQDPTQVFRGPLVLGVVTDNLLFETIDLAHEDVYGQVMTWHLTCNTSELSTSAVPTI